MHRKRQRHPQRYRHHRRRIAPRVLAKLLPGEAAQQRPQGRRAKAAGGTVAGGRGDVVGHSAIVLSWAGTGVFYNRGSTGGVRDRTEKYPIHLIWVMPA